MSTGFAGRQGGRGLPRYTGRVKSNRSRRFAAHLALVAVLFSQLAVSAFACPGMDGMAQAAAAAEVTPPCHEQPSPEAVTPLCQAHCQQGDQSSDVRGASLPLFALVALPAALSTHAGLRAVPVIEAQLSLLERPTGPPLAVRHCRLRI
jgi:hypothetical protein